MEITQEIWKVFKRFSLEKNLKIISSTTLNLELQARPGSKKNIFKINSENQLIITINSPPVDGAANEALIKYLATFFWLSKRKVTLLKGQKSKNKILVLDFGDMNQEHRLVLIDHLESSLIEMFELTS